MSQLQQRLLTGFMLFTAVGLLVLAIVYQEDTNISATSSTKEPQAEESESPTSFRNKDLILKKYPFGGSGGACRERVGVDLQVGYGATFTLNDKAIPKSLVEVVRRPFNSYTFKPQDACPKGTFVRPTGNQLVICVYKLDDAAQTCLTREVHTFDAA